MNQFELAIFFIPCLSSWAPSLCSFSTSKEDHTWMYLWPFSFAQHWRPCVLCDHTQDLYLPPLWAVSSFSLPSPLPDPLRPDTSAVGGSPYPVSHLLLSAALVTVLTCLLTAVWLSQQVTLREGRPWLQGSPLRPGSQRTSWLFLGPRDCWGEMEWQGRDLAAIC